MRLLRASLCLLALIALSAPAVAATRVFVSSSGLDSGTCPITSPCRSFSYALLQVAAGGEIIALDTAGYGTANINQAVTIFAAPGATAFIAASSGDAIAINAAATDVVNLRGLALTSTGATAGIDFLMAHSVNVENTIINGFSLGIRFAMTGVQSNPTLQIINSTIRNNDTGIYAANAGAGAAGGPPPANLSFVTVSRSFFSGSATAALVAYDNSRVSVSDSVFAGNAGYGVQAGATADYSYSEVNLDRCTISRNSVGILTGSSIGILPYGIVRLANCMITANDTGIVNLPTGLSWSRVSNSVYTNTIDGNILSNGAPSGTYNGK